MLIVVNYINKLLTEEEFLQKVFGRSKSLDSMNASKAAINNLKYFCKDQYKKDSDEVLADIQKEINNTNNPRVVLAFLDKFVEWLQVPHHDIVIVNSRNQSKKPLLAKNATSIPNYVSRVRRYMKMCYGIRIMDDDISDYVTFPISESDEEAEPFEPEELRNVIDNASSPKRKTMYMFQKDTGARILETVRVKKKHIDLTTNPPTVTLPKSIVKGKTKTRVNYLTKETTPRIALLLKNLDDEDFVFRENKNQTEYQARKNEQGAFRRLCNNLGYTERYDHNNRFKKNIHSIRAFCCTQYEDATNNERMAHGYIGHKRYLQQYTRSSDEKKIRLFTQAESKLSLYEIHVIVDESGSVDDLKKENLMLHERLAKVEQMLDIRKNFH